MGKDFAWIREFATHCVSILDWENELKAKRTDLEKILSTKGNSYDDIIRVLDNNMLSNSKNDMKRYKVICDTLETVERIKKETIHNFKFMVDVFNYLSSSTLSLGGAAFDKLTTSRFEYAYPGMEAQQMGTQPGSPSRFNFNIRK